MATLLRTGLVLVVVLSSACKKDASDPDAKPAVQERRDQAPSTEVEPVKRATEHERVSVRVDPRVELFSMLFRAAENPSYTGLSRDTPYENAIDAKIAALREHPAVATSRELLRDYGIGFNAPVGLAVYLSWPELAPRRPLAPFPPHLDERWKNVDIDAYLEQVRDFARAGEIEAFFAAQAPYFERVEASLSDFVQPYPLVPWFHAFFGDDSTEHVLVQGLLTGSNNYGATVELPSGELEAHQIVVIWNADDQGVPRPAEDLLVYVVHEGAHAYVNPRNRKAEATLRPGAEALFAHVEQIMQRHAYGHWHMMVDESLVRAVTRLYLREAGASKALDKAAAQDDEEGFVWVGDLVQMLEAERRAQGASFSYEAALPEAEKILARWASDDAALRRMQRFVGPINAAIQRGPTVVRPTGAARLDDYVDDLAAKLGFEVVPAADVKELSADKTWMLYGSPSTNAALGTFLVSQRWTIEEDRIALGKKAWTGKGLVLIAAVPHPENDTRAVVVYASHDAADVVGINDVFHGPTDWVIARRTPKGLEQVDTGDFPKNDDGTYRPLAP